MSSPAAIRDDAQDQLALDQLHNADHDKDGGDIPQNGRIHDAIHTSDRPLYPLLPGRLPSRGLLQMERFFGSVSSPSGRGCPGPRGGCYN
jgi:hypothetical protein